MHMPDDPSLHGGFTQLYQIEKPFKLNNNLKSLQDTFMARIFKSPTSYKIELTSQNNVSFLYRCLIDSHSLADIASLNSIQLTMQSVLEWMRQIFHDDLSYQLLMKDQENAQLKMMKTQKFKVYDIAKLPFQIGSDEQVRESIMFRYSKMVNRKELLIQYWAKMTNIIKMKCPSLLINLDNSKKIKKAFK